MAVGGGMMASTEAFGKAGSKKPLSGKVAIVTGARANMGRAFCAALAELGANVVIHYHRKSTKKQALETSRLVQKAGAKAVLVQGDLGDVKNVKKLYDTAEKKFGGIDIVINNAGAIIKKPIAQFTDADFDKLDRVNNRALFYSLREAAKRVRPGGRIINNGTSLLAGAAPGYSVYAGTKAPVEEYTRMVAKELGDKKITVNCIAPGPIDTPFFHSQENKNSAAYASRLSAEKRLGKVSDIAPLVSFLATPESQWVNGQTLFINGGYLTR
ncbi:MAG: SDR family oxidoreductase [Pseudobacteriovorax sp.]|nr:SDR family oxidoreductase [Pseudobacteriovorax sp.]